MEIKAVIFDLDGTLIDTRITSYNVCYTKLLRITPLVVPFITTLVPGIGELSAAETTDPVNVH